MKSYTIESYKRREGGMQNTRDFMTTWSINYANSNLVSDLSIIPNLHLTVSQIGPIGQEVHLEKSSNK